MNKQTHKTLSLYIYLYYILYKNDVWKDIVTLKSGEMTFENDIYILKQVK